VLLTQIIIVVGGTAISHKLAEVANLLQFMSADMSAEVAYNKREAALSPHCCICSLFASVIDHSLRSHASQSDLVLPRYVHCVSEKNKTPNSCP